MTELYIKSTFNQETTTITEALLENVICRHGALLELQTDQNRKFDSEECRDLMELFVIKKIRITALHWCLCSWYFATAKGWRSDSMRNIDQWTSEGHQPICRKGLSWKLQRHWKRRYRIAKKASELDYTLQLTCRSKPKVHAERLPRNGRELPGWINKMRVTYGISADYAGR